MNKRLSKKQKWFKKINPAKDDKIHVGIDVHKESCSVALLLNVEHLSEVVLGQQLTLALS